MTVEVDVNAAFLLGGCAGGLNVTSYGTYITKKLKGFLLCDKAKWIMLI